MLTRLVSGETSLSLETIGFLLRHHMTFPHMTFPLYACTFGVLSFSYEDSSPIGLGTHLYDFNLNSLNALSPNKYGPIGG